MHNFHGHMFRAKMWRNYVNVWDGKPSSTGIANRAWLEWVEFPNRQECLRRARSHVDLARSLNLPRELTSHKSNHLNKAIKIEVLDPPGPGGACRQYRMVTGDPAFTIDLPFQNGNPAIKINGISNEALLAIVEDRMIGFQTGEFACDNNERALEHVRSALRCLNARTAERRERGIEGTQVI